MSPHWHLKFENWWIPACVAERSAGSSRERHFTISADFCSFWNDSERTAASTNLLNSVL